MLERYYFVEVLFVLLAVALVVAIIKYPKDALVKLPLAILLFPFRPIWSIIKLFLRLVVIPLGERYDWKFTSHIEKIAFGSAVEKEDRPYPSKKNLKVDFEKGDKFIFASLPDGDLKELISDFLGVLSIEYILDDFRIKVDSQRHLVKTPANITFYDFHLLVQHFGDEIGIRKSFGMFKSKELHYFVYKDENTLNNLVGFTSDKRYFSVNMYDDLDAKSVLKLNQDLELETEWVEEWSTTIARLNFVA